MWHLQKPFGHFKNFFYFQKLTSLISRGDKFGEAAEVGLVRNQLLQIYNEKLHLQVKL